MSFLYSIVSYLYASCSGSITSVGEEIAKEFCYRLLFYNVVSVKLGFLFILVLWMGCVILLCHSLGLPYNYFTWPDTVSHHLR